MTGSRLAWLCGRHQESGREELQAAGAGRQQEAQVRSGGQGELEEELEVVFCCYAGVRASWSSTIE